MKTNESQMYFSRPAFYGLLLVVSLALLIPQGLLWPESLQWTWWPTLGMAGVRAIIALVLLVVADVWLYVRQTSRVK